MGHSAHYPEGPEWLLNRSHTSVALNFLSSVTREAVPPAFTFPACHLTAVLSPMCHDRMCKALSAAEFLPFLGPMRQSVRAFQENTAQTNICFCQNQPYTPQLCSWAFACVHMTTHKRTTAFRSGAEGSAASCLLGAVSVPQEEGRPAAHGNRLKWWQ